MTAKILYRALLQLSDMENPVYLFRIIDDGKEYFTFARYKEFVTSYTREELQECVFHVCVDYFTHCEDCFNEDREYITAKVLEKKELNIELQEFDDLLWEKYPYEAI